MRIAVFCPNLVGDGVMATPALRALRRGFDGATIVGIARPAVAATLDGAPWFDDVWIFDPRSKTTEHRSLGIVRRLRAQRTDIAVLLPNSYRSAILATLGGARRRIGYAKGGRGLLLTDRLSLPTDDRGRRLPSPIVHHYLEITRRLGCRADSVRTELYTTAADEVAADRAWERLGLPRSGPVVTLNTGGAFGPAKAWPASHFAHLARRLAIEAGAHALVLCGPAERGAAIEIVGRARHPNVVSLADEPLGIGLSKACVRRSALLVTTDSGPRHFAAPFDVPCLTLFGPTHIAWTRTYHPRAAHIFRPVDCGPCQRPTCPLGHHRCMRELDPDDVFATASRMLGQRPALVEALA
jgi:heptosyltransferase-2